MMEVNLILILIRILILMMEVNLILILIRILMMEVILLIRIVEMNRLKPFMV